VVGDAKSIDDQGKMCNLSMMQIANYNINIMDVLGDKRSNSSTMLIDYVIYIYKEMKVK